MDPNTNLQEQEQLLQEISEYAENPQHPACINARADLRELRRALHDWLNAGGFQPDWSKAPNAARYYGSLAEVDVCVSCGLQGPWKGAPEAQCPRCLVESGRVR